MSWLWPFRSRPSPQEAARTLGQIGHEQRRAKYRATARAICEASGQPIPDALKD